MKKNKFIQIVKENRNLIFKICYTYCRDPENRKDLEQEILLQLWKSFEKFDGRVKISTWIYRITLNTAISFYRKDKKHVGDTVSIDESIISLSSLGNDLEQNENISLLYQFIDRFSKIDKALILLYLDNNKYKEIAGILGISETNVATKINRIKKTLKKQFDTN